MRRSTIYWILGGSAMTAMIISGIGWCLSTHAEPGVVTDLHWKNVVQRQVWTQVQKETWRTSIRESKPVDPVGGKGESPGAEIGSCESRVHHHDSYPCGSHPVTVGATTTQQTDWCERPVYRDWCRYTTHVWSPAGDRVLSGNDSDPKWPDDFETTDIERNVRIGKYQASIRYGGTETYTATISSESQFRTWYVGENVTLSVRNMGSVVGVSGR